MQTELLLPPKILLEEYKGDFPIYFEKVYEIFKKDFVDTKPNYRGKHLGLKKYPLVEGKEYTFYHMTHKGNIEKERLPDLRRLERIPFARPIIDFSTDSALKVWENKRNNDKRILIFHDVENYLVVLADRKEYILPWTTYFIEFKNRKEKLLKEYEAYLKAKTA